MTFGDVLGGVAPLVGMAVNAATAEGNDRRQTRQQKKLTDMQVKANKELSEFQRKQQMQMWHDTNWSAQVEEAKKAGMSVSALLGNGAGGGGTAAASTGAGATGGQAADAATTQQADIQTGMSVAQMNLIKAQTAKTEAETENIAGGEKEKLNAEVQSLTQGVATGKAQEALTRATQNIEELRGNEMVLTRRERMQMIYTQADKLKEELAIVKNDRSISDDTKNTKIAQAKAEFSGAILENKLKASKIEMNKAEMAKWQQELAQGLGRLQIEGQRAGNEQVRTMIEKANMIFKNRSDIHLIRQGTMDIEDILEELEKIK